jgi:hypothetical protein
MILLTLSALLLKRALIVLRSKRVLEREQRERKKLRRILRKALDE